MIVVMGKLMQGMSYSDSQQLGICNTLEKQVEVQK